MIVFQSCGKSLASLYAGSTTAVINIYQINREHVHSPLALPLPVERQLNMIKYWKRCVFTRMSSVRSTTHVDAIFRGSSAEEPDCWRTWPIKIQVNHVRFDALQEYGRVLRQAWKFILICLSRIPQI